jgi:hypothetical protein
MPWILKLVEAGSYETLVPIPILYGATSLSAGFAMWMTLLHLATWSQQAEWLPEPPNQHPSEHSVHHGDQKGEPPSLPRQRYLYETQQLSGPQSVPQTHPYKSLPQCQVPSPSILQTSCTFYTGAQSSLQWRLCVRLVFLIGVFRQNGYKNWQTQ